MIGGIAGRQFCRLAEAGDGFIEFSHGGIDIAQCIPNLGSRPSILTAFLASEMASWLRPRARQVALRLMRSEAIGRAVLQGPFINLKRPGRIFLLHRR